MTRTEFIEEVLDFGDLISFCDGEGCGDIVEHIYDKDSVDDIIMEEICSGCFGCATWQELYGILDNMPDCEWYDLEYDYDETDFDEKKDEVLDYMDNNGLWEDEEGEDEEDDETFVLDEDDEEDEDQGLNVNADDVMVLLENIL